MLTLFCFCLNYVENALKPIQYINIICTFARKQAKLRKNFNFINYEQI